MIEHDTLKVNAALDRMIREVPAPHNPLYIAARYSLLSPGKRIRPLLTLATGRMLGGTFDALLEPACALEMIHAYSLIHDDLPAMDNDDFRRGKPSLHKAHGEGRAILAGDFLLTYAFQILSEAPHLSASLRLQLIATLAKASGGEGMIGGQVMDLEKSGHALEEINAKKTGALLTAAIQFGAIIAEAPKEVLASLTLFGQKVGLLFQLCDDIVDGERSDALLDAHTDAHALYTDALAILALLPGDASSLKALLKKIISQIR